MRRFAYSVPRLRYVLSTGQRPICSTFSARVDKKKVDELLNPLSQKYADAKDEYEIATESLGTTYAKEDIASTKELTEEVVREYNSILNSSFVGEEEKKVVKERVGERIRELVNAVDENLKEED